MSGERVQLVPVHRRQAGGRRPRQPVDRPLDRPALRLGRPRRARRQAVRRGRAVVRRARPRRPAGDDDPRREAPEDRREVGPRRGHRAEQQGHERGRQGARLQEGRAVDDQPQEQGPPQRRARRGRLRDRRARRLRRQRRLLRGLDQARVPAAVRRGRQGLSASRVRRSSRSTTRSASTTGRSPRARC